MSCRPRSGVRSHVACRAADQQHHIRETTGVSGSGGVRRCLTDDAAAAGAFISCIEHLAGAIGIPTRLRDLGAATANIPALVAGSRGNSMAGNPRDVSDTELAALLESML